MFFENLKLALRSMKGSRMRTVLSLLGIIIGVASVVTILNLGRSATGSITDSLSSSGYNIIYLTPSRRGTNIGDTFDELFGETLKENVGGIKVVMPINSANNTKVRYQKEIETAMIMGVQSDFAENLEYTAEQGEWFSAQDNIFKRQVVVLGANIAKELFPAGDAVGSYVTIFRTQGKRYQVVAVMDSKDATMGISYDNSVFIPYNTYTQRFMHVNNVGSYIIKVDDNADPVSVGKNVTTYMDALVGDNNYMIISSASLAEMASSVAGTFSMFLAAIGGISLLVGGIGIMNIMLVSVAERTKEIGIRKALGASPRVIKGQFLTEAVTLTSIGGALGILFGIGISKVVANMAKWPFKLSVNACVLSVCFSMLVGVFFGLYPAAKAAKMDPVESLSYE